ncbi:hypothetical protein BGZ61DRAFT_478176 [Ilyonectria robusta]|uniref:uncharacterized protein n=1 Tax=Ilyonectria robusta TaxID=1079257 RepID=UPI001E8D608C|nr:uncharacterized protein BGZ61DRAFT_478176 [Ilyonectria robusta]KAH8694580.1 hypothetical protein BGZ61DRAFT_478176 [Ilyonectria robusta]
MPEESFGLFSSSVVRRFTRTSRSAEAQRHQIHLKYRLLSFVPRPSSVLRPPSSPSDASCTATGPWRIGGIRGASMEWSTLVGCCLAACVRWTPCRDDGDGGWLMLKVMRRKSLGAGCVVARPFREMSPKDHLMNYHVLDSSSSLPPTRLNPKTPSPIVPPPDGIPLPRGTQLETGPVEDH